MDIRIIAASSSTDLVASPPLTRLGREMAFATAWAECDQVDAPANVDATATAKPELHTQGELPDNQDESSIEDQTISAECSADHLCQQTVTMSQTIATDLPSLPRSWNLQQAELELEPSVKLPGGQTTPSLILPPPESQSMEAMEISPERPDPVTAEYAGIELFQPEAEACQLAQSNRLTNSSTQEGDKHTFSMAEIKPLFADEPVIKTSSVSSKTDARQSIAAIGMVLSSKSEQPLAVDSDVPPTPQQNALGTSAQKDAELAAIGRAPTGNPTDGLEFIPNPVSTEVSKPAEAPLLGKIYPGQSLHSSSTPPFTTRIDSELARGEDANSTTNDISIDSDYTSRPPSSQENIKNTATMDTIEVTTDFTLPPRKKILPLVSKTHAPTGQAKVEHDSSSKDWATHLSSNLQFEKPNHEAGGKYEAPAQHAVDNNQIPKSARELMDFGMPIPDAGRSTGTVAPPSGSSPHHPTTLPPSQQIANSIIANQNSNDEVELILNPEELGCVTFKISRTDETFAITISVDRLDTLQLLRRNLDTLTAELSQAGISGASINLSDSSRDRRAPPPIPATSGAGESEQAFSEPPPRTRTTPLRDHAGRLNLRL